eukprot:gene18886-22564_t
MKDLCNNKAMLQRIADVFAPKVEEPPTPVAEEVEVPTLRSTSGWSTVGKATRKVTGWKGWVPDDFSPMPEVQQSARKREVANVPSSIDEEKHSIAQPTENGDNKPEADKPEAKPAEPQPVEPPTEVKPQNLEEHFTFEDLDVDPMEGVSRTSEQVAVRKRKPRGLPKVAPVVEEPQDAAAPLDISSDQSEQPSQGFPSLEQKVSEGKGNKKAEKGKKKSIRIGGNDKRNAMMAAKKSNVSAKPVSPEQSPEPNIELDPAFAKMLSALGKVTNGAAAAAAFLGKKAGTESNPSEAANSVEHVEVVLPEVLLPEDQEDNSRQLEATRRQTEMEVDDSPARSKDPVLRARHRSKTLGSKEGEGDGKETPGADDSSLLAEENEEGDPETVELLGTPEGETNEEEDGDESIEPVQVGINAAGKPIFRQSRGKSTKKQKRRRESVDRKKKAPSGEVTADSHQGDESGTDDNDNVSYQSDNTSEATEDPDTLMEATGISDVNEAASTSPEPYEKSNTETPEPLSERADSISPVGGVLYRESPDVACYEVGGQRVAANLDARSSNPSPTGEWKRGRISKGGTVHDERHRRMSDGGTTYGSDGQDRGRVSRSGTMYDPRNRRMSDGGTCYGLKGEVIGRFSKSGISYDARNQRISEGGTCYDTSGNIHGRVLPDGTAVDPWNRRVSQGGTCYDQGGQRQGSVTPNGTHRDNWNRRISNGGTVYTESEKAVAHMQEDGTCHDAVRHFKLDTQDGTLYNAQQEQKGRLSPRGTVYDLNDNLVTPTGKVYNKGGEVIGQMDLRGNITPTEGMDGQETPLPAASHAEPLPESTQDGQVELVEQAKEGGDKSRLNISRGGHYYNLEGSRVPIERVNPDRFRPVNGSERLLAGGSMVAEDGTLFNKEGQKVGQIVDGLCYDSRGWRVEEDGTLRAADGSTRGKMDHDGQCYDMRGRRISQGGTLRHVASGVVQGRISKGGTCYDQRGRRVSVGGTVYAVDGTKQGRLADDGTYYDSQGRRISAGGSLDETAVTLASTEGKTQGDVDPSSTTFESGTSYDARGRRMSVGGTLYDAEGQVQGRVEVDGTSYDTRGRRMSVGGTLYDAAGQGRVEADGTSYHTRGRRTSVGGTLYDAEGQVQGRVELNGTSYDARGRRTSVGGTLYDAAGQVQGRVEADGTSYDARGRRMSVEGTLYDAEGQVQGRVEADGTSYDARGRRMSVGGTLYDAEGQVQGRVEADGTSYDARGRRTSVGGTLYDAAGQ